MESIGGTLISKRNKKKPVHRSHFEDKIIASLKRRKISHEYESLYIEYEVTHKYTPDIILPNGVIVEIKGRFVGKDRSKHLAIKKQHPELDIRFVFMNPKGRLYKGSKTTYAQWCDKHGFIWAKDNIPTKWSKEK